MVAKERNELFRLGLVKVARSLSGPVLSRAKAYWERPRGRFVFRAITRRLEMKILLGRGAVPTAKLGSFAAGSRGDNRCGNAIMSARAC